MFLATSTTTILTILTFHSVLLASDHHLSRLPFFSQCYGFQRALYEGFSLAFLMPLQAASRAAVELLMQTRILKYRVVTETVSHRTNTGSIC